jgi:hypothetical protein
MPLNKNSLKNRIPITGLGAGAFFTPDPENDSFSEHVGSPTSYQPVNRSAPHPEAEAIERNAQATTTSTGPARSTLPLVKATFYLTTEQILDLERLRLKRRERGEKVDKSALVRQAIERLVMDELKSA